MQHGSDYISAMPTNLYGPNDNFHPEFSHVPSALIRRFHESKVSGMEKVKVWGTGTPRREFMHVDDLADACLFLLQNYSDIKHINVGTGKHISILEFAKLVKNIVGFKGSIELDDSKPDGMKVKKLDTSLINNLGWHPKIELEPGLKKTYTWALESGVL